jgi:hypothetical protein
MSAEVSHSISGHISLPQPVPGTLGHVESRVKLDDEREWRVVHDSTTGLATVFDENGSALGWTVEAGKGIRQVVLPGGAEPPVFFEDRLFKHRVWIGDTALKPVMMLEGRKRVFGDDRIRVEHRDFTNEARFQCAPEFLIAGIIVAQEIYSGRAMLRSGGR